MARRFSPLFWTAIVINSSRPETYERPAYPLEVTIYDVSGDEDKYTLDSHGFQIYRHESKEKDFADDGKIKAEYYQETEQLLKNVYASLAFC